MLQTTVLALHGLSCMNCAKRVKTALESREDVHHAQVDVHYAKVTGEAETKVLIDTVKQAGYQAEIAQTPDVELQLSGLSCGHCTESTRKALEAVPGVVAAEVSLDSAKVFGQVEAKTLIDAVEQAGYHATLQGADSPKSEPLTHSAPSQPEHLAAASSTVPAAIHLGKINKIGAESQIEPTQKTKNTEQNQSTTPTTPTTPSAIEPVDTETDSESVQLLLTGMSCASCVSKVQNALESVEGVEVARVNLAERSALVTANLAMKL